MKEMNVKSVRKYYGDWKWLSPIEGKVAALSKKYPDA